MVLRQIRFRLVTTLNVGAFCFAALWIAMLLPGHHGTLATFFIFGVIAAWLVIPVAVIAHLILGRFLQPAERLDNRRYFLLSYVVLVLGWAVFTPFVVFLGPTFIGTSDIWPLSLRHGPDTDDARSGFARAFGFYAPTSATSIYFREISYGVGDGTEWIRFHYQDGSTVERVVRQLDLTRIDPSEVPRDRSGPLRAKDIWIDWWPYAKINTLEIIYIDRPTRSEITGRTRPSPTRHFIKVLWIDEKEKTAYFRAIAF